MTAVQNKTSFLSKALFYKKTPKVADATQKYDIKEILKANDSDDMDYLKSLITNLNPYDKAEILNSISNEDFRNIISRIFNILESEILIELNEYKIKILIDEIEEKDLIYALLRLELDDLAYFVSLLDKDNADIIISNLPKNEKKYVKRSLTYSENQIGRLVDIDFVTFTKNNYVSDVKAALFNKNDMISHDAQDIFILDEEGGNLIGTVKIVDVLTSNDDKPLISILDEDFQTVMDTDDKSEITYIFNKYNISSLIVFDRNQHIIGFISVNVAMELFAEEKDETLLRLSGVSENYVEVGVWKKSYSRSIWLALNLVTSLIAASIISQFETVIAQYSYLTIFLPVVASIGGNSGNQISAFTLSIINTRYINILNQSSIIYREIFGSILSALFIASLAFGFGFLISKSYIVAELFSLAVACNIVFSSLFGLIIPFVIKRLKLDPTLTSSIFITALTDFCGFFIFLKLISFFFK